MEVILDSDGTAGWETKNVTITEVADADKYSISLGRAAFGSALLNDGGGDGANMIKDLRIRLTSTTNLELKYWDLLNIGSSVVPVFITAKLA